MEWKEALWDRFYRWYDLYQTGGLEALEDRSPRPSRVWNRIPAPVRERIVQLALDEPELSPRELAVRFTDTESYFGRGQTILLEREKIKRQTIEHRRLQHRKSAAENDQPDAPEPPVNTPPAKSRWLQVTA